VNISDVETFRRSLRRLRGDKRELVLIVFEQLIKVGLYKNSNALSQALKAMLVALDSWAKPRTTQDLAAMEAIFELISKARPLRQEGAYRRHMVQRNQELGDRKAKISRSQLLEAVQRLQPKSKTDAEMSTAIAREHDVDPRTVERRIRRYRAKDNLPKRSGRGGFRKKAR
jgi:hypothetical protein